MIDKETFINTINFLEVMIRKEKNDQETELYLKNIFNLLYLFFPDPASAKLEIEHYCFDINFGKPSMDAEYITPGDLYEKLL